MPRLLTVVLLLGVVVLTGGCAQDDMNASSRESTLPWSRPEKWEGPGVLGSQMSSAQGGY